MDIVEKLRRQADSDEQAGTILAHEIGREAADEIERLRQDAKRYRYLRDECLYSNGYDTGLDMCRGIPCHAAPNKADIDAAIDASMSNA